MKNLNRRSEPGLFAAPVRPVVAGEIMRFSGASICHDILTLQMGFPVFAGVQQQVHDNTSNAFTIRSQSATSRHR
ncbi:hypothetical protein KEX41_28530 (plasmid) [Burkholderia thailandensis]|uniref:hypothetical protein n=1 Tax=Burkholderia thailandensis TaxID=57975 RepID=UPI00192D9546|nr:hypothetical protein [Burkholderia thailandensis]MBS2132136.1 hypothetical protein [Burkholderia thailandensis]QRA15242.1 hypothetical protein JMY07_28955 [Burkholderia thailandensis]